MNVIGDGIHYLFICTDNIIEQKRRNGLKPYYYRIITDVDLIIGFISWYIWGSSHSFQPSVLCEVNW